MAGYLGLAMVVGYWMASQFAVSSDALREEVSSSGITASTGSSRQMNSNVIYGNCNQARPAAAAPTYENEPGYAARLDANNEGTACEPYYGPVKNFGRKAAERRTSRYSASP